MKRIWPIQHVETDCGCEQQIASTKPQKLRIGILNTWSLILTIAIGGQYFAWNVGLQMGGFGSFLIGFILTGISFICLCLSCSELSSALPLAGTSYPLIRISVGFYCGFISGSSELTKCIIFSTVATLSLARIITELFPSISHFMTPLLCLFINLSAVFIILPGGIFFWRVILSLGILSLLILICFIFGSLPFVNVSNYSNIQTVVIMTTENGYNESLIVRSSEWFVNEVSGFFMVLPLACRFFIGVESINWCSDIIHMVSIMFTKVISIIYSILFTPFKLFVLVQFCSLLPRFLGLLCCLSGLYAPLVYVSYVL